MLQKKVLSKLRCHSTYFTFFRDSSLFGAEKPNLSAFNFKYNNNALDASPGFYQYITINGKDKGKRFPFD